MSGAKASTTPNILTIAGKDGMGEMRVVRWRKQVFDEQPIYQTQGRPRKLPSSYSKLHLTRTGIRTLCGVPILVGCVDGLAPEYFAGSDAECRRVSDCHSCKSGKAANVQLAAAIKKVVKALDEEI